MTPPENLAGLPPIERARRAAELTEHHRQLVGHYATVRAAAIAEARETMTADDVASQLGISRQAVTKRRKSA